MRVLVTGGATGIGAQLVLKLKKTGHHVTVLDIRQPEFEVDVYIPLNLADEMSIHTAVTALKDSYDALCNVAGIAPVLGNGLKVLEINFLGTRLLTELVLPKLISNAAIVNVASKAGEQWGQHLDQVTELLRLDSWSQLAEFQHKHELSDARAYNLSKEAVIVWTKQLSTQFLARGMRVNSVSPAAVSTGLLNDFKHAFGDVVDKNLSRVGRAGLPEEVADVVLYLLSPQSHWLKGIDICVDGGMGAAQLVERLAS